MGYLARASATEPDKSTSALITNTAVEGGLVGVLMGVGIPEAEARYY